MTIPDEIKRRLFLDMAAMPHRRGPWSQAEDGYLMSLVQTQGALNWVRIANMLGSRTPKQCRERYHQNLKPTLNHEPITPEEGLVIERLVHEIGKRWAEIARRLHGRSDNAVKNWWNGSQNRKKRMERRKVAHVGYDERTDASAYSRTALATPRTLPFPGSRPLPSTLYQTSLHGHERPYGVETPLPSPSVYSPESEGAPSLMSDTGSYYSTSPMSYEVRQPELELPPLKIAAYSPRLSPSPTERVLLPSLSSITSPQFAVSPLDIYKAEPPPLGYHHHHNPHQKTTATSQLPTAPNSPVDFASSLQLRPYRSADQRQERSRTKVSLNNLLS